MKLKFFSTHIIKFLCASLVVALPVQSVMHFHLKLPIVQSLQAKAMASKTNKFSNRNIQTEQRVNQFFIDKRKELSGQIDALRGKGKKVEKYASWDSHNLIFGGSLSLVFGISAGIASGIMYFLPNVANNVVSFEFVRALAVTLSVGGATLLSLDGLLTMMSKKRAYKIRKKIGELIIAENKKNPKYYMHLFNGDEKMLLKDYQKATEQKSHFEELKHVRKNLLQRRYSKFRYTLAHVAAAYNDDYFFEPLNPNLEEEERENTIDHTKHDHNHRYLDENKDLFHQPDVFGVHPVDIALKMGHIKALKQILPKKGILISSYEDQKKKIRWFHEALQRRVEKYVNRSLNDIPKVLSHIKTIKISSVREGVPYHSPRSIKTFNHLAFSIINETLTADKLDQALQEDFNINTVDPYGNTLLHIAMGSENIDAVILLLKRQASTEIKNNQNTTFHGLLYHTAKTLYRLVQSNVLTKYRQNTHKFVIDPDHELEQKVLSFYNRYEKFKKQSYKSSFCLELLTTK